MLLSRKGDTDLNAEDRGGEKFGAACLKKNRVTVSELIGASWHAKKGPIKKKKEFCNDIHMGKGPNWPTSCIWSIHIRQSISKE